MLQKVYMASWQKGQTGGGNFSDTLCQVMLTHAPLKLWLRKFLNRDGKLDGSMYGGARAKFTVQTLSNLTKTGNGSVLMASGVLNHVDVCVTAKAGKSTVGYTDAYELEGAQVEIWFDLENETGVMVAAQIYESGAANRLVSLPRLDLMRTENDILDDRQLKEMGLPEELVKCYDLLLELGLHQL